MKRRNADCSKLRRIKRNKISDQLGSNTLLYLKFLLLWAVVITADFLLEFRFEFLWPFWLLLRSVHDSFKYKGLAFSVLFVCIAITSDLVCLFFIPVQWLFFAASTYVWVQYVWHTDKGICLPTIILWILFVYLEAAIRWKDNRNIPHMDLCRPFAAHCIGYPVVTLGFGFKSYVGYRIRQRKQREVAKENEFYMQLLQDALPKDETALTIESNEADSQQQLVEQKEVLVNDSSLRLKKAPSDEKKVLVTTASASVPAATQNNNIIKNAQSKISNNIHTNGHAGSSITAPQNSSKNLQKKTSENNSLFSNASTKNSTNNYTCQNNSTKSSSTSNDSLSKSKELEKETTTVQLVPASLPVQINDVLVVKQNGHIVNNDIEIPQQTCDHSSENSTTVEKAPAPRLNKKNRAKQQNNHNNNHNNNKDNHNEHQHCDCCAKLEVEAKKLKSEIGSLKCTENELRQKLESNAITKSSLLVKQKENDDTQQKLLKKIREERRHRQSLEAQLNNERKLRKTAEEKASRPECTENCKLKRQQLEMEINKLRRDLMQTEDAKHNAEKHSRNMEQELRNIEMEFRSRESQEVLMSALAAMQDKNATLEKNLSAETRVKLDLFSALGEAKRQIEINNCNLRNKELEIMDLKAKMVQLLAVMPQIPNELNSSKDNSIPLSSSSIMSQLLLQSNSSSSMGNGVSSQSQSPLLHIDFHSAGQIVQMNSDNCPSNLDPNATVYTPKNSIEA